MITSTIKQLPKSTVEIEIKISWDEIKVTYEKIFDQVTKELELPGFRKGKAPKELAEKNVNKTKIFEEVIREIIPKAYANAIKEHNLQPIISPKIEVMKAKENEEWVVKATIALRPKVTLKSYKEKIKEAKKPKAKIWTPGEPKE
ncbi:trigger factor family protein, partial [Candidatus Microgenomates bacterium]|nr:trigger factor family protein [Candidatus Microgenomates bacterium]